MTYGNALCTNTDKMSISLSFLIYYCVQQIIMYSCHVIDEFLFSTNIGQNVLFNCISEQTIVCNCFTCIVDMGQHIMSLQRIVCVNIFQCHI